MGSRVEMGPGVFQGRCAQEWVFRQTGSAQLLPVSSPGGTVARAFFTDRLPARAVASLDLDPVTGRGPPVLPTRRCSLRRPHRLDPPPAPPLGAHSRGGGWCQPAVALGPVPSHLDPFPGTLRTSRTRSRRQAVAEADPARRCGQFCESADTTSPEGSLSRSTPRVVTNRSSALFNETSQSTT